MVTKKGNLKQFSLVIYPVDYVVAIGDLEQEVNKLYTPYEEGFNWIAPPKTTGCTYRVKEKKAGIPCIMVWVKSKEEFTTSIVSHECAHATMEIWQYIGSEVSLDNQEPFCYLLGNLVRLAIGCFYEIPGVQPPVVSHDAFINPEKLKTKK